jgi:hypothetical protein
MLEGFKNGKNITWGIAFDKNLGNSIQLSLTYDGRKLHESPPVHTGGCSLGPSSKNSVSLGASVWKFTLILKLTQNFPI